MDDKIKIEIFDSFIKRVGVNFITNEAKKRNKQHNLDLAGESAILRQQEEIIVDEYDCLNYKIVVSDIAFMIKNPKLFTALKKLNERELKVITSKTLINKTHVEVSEEIGVCEKTVRNIYKKAMAKMRNNIEGE